MNVEIFALCDYAADYGGKFTVVGTFDSIFAQQLPAVHPYCSIAVRLRFEKIEEGQKRVRISVCDEDGKPVLQPIEIPITVTVPPDSSSQTVQVVGNIGGLKLEQYGEYSIDIAIDGRREAGIPLFVKPAPRQHQSQSRG